MDTGGDDKKRCEYDDPYSFLALHIILSSGQFETQRMLFDDDHIRRMLIKEVRGQDLCGPFVDAIITDILSNGERMEMCQELDKLALYFYKKLDLPRLRDKIAEYKTKFQL